MEVFYSVKVTMDYVRFLTTVCSNCWRETNKCRVEYIGISDWFLPMVAANSNKKSDIEYRAFRLVVRSSFVFASSNCDWLKWITWFISANHSCCLQKQMKIELQIERLYCGPDGRNAGRCCSKWLATTRPPPSSWMRSTPSLAAGRGTRSL